MWSHVCECVLAPVHDPLAVLRANAALSQCGPTGCIDDVALRAPPTGSLSLDAFSLALAAAALLAWARPRARK
jgi:hypothetical protein